MDRITCCTVGTAYFFAVPSDSNGKMYRGRTIQCSLRHPDTLVLTTLQETVSQLSFVGVLLI